MGPPRLRHLPLREPEAGVTTPRRASISPAHGVTTLVPGRRPFAIVVGEERWRRLVWERRMAQGEALRSKRLLSMFNHRR
jgi:hypothetical protein